MNNLPISDREARVYRGKWVAVRRGRVIAAATSLSALLLRFGVRETDTRWKVPR